MKGDTIKVDLFKILLDHEKEQDIKGDLFSHLRYSIINTSLLLVGSTAKNAVPLKPYIGKSAYTFSAIIEILKHFVGNYDIDVDHGRYKINNLQTLYMQIYNGKFGGGKIMLNPIGLINDGYMDLVFMSNAMNGITYPAKALSMFSKAKSGGTHFYNNDFVCYRCKALKLYNKCFDKIGQKLP